MEEPSPPSDDSFSSTIPRLIQGEGPQPSTVPRLLSLAASSMKKNAFLQQSPLLPQVQNTLSHDHNAFLCSLFNKIDLDKEKESLGPFSTSSQSSKSIIADAVEQHKPVGQEDLPQYNDTISSMVINAYKRVFKTDLEASQELPACKTASSHSQNLNNLCNVDSIRRAVYGNVPAKRSLHVVRIISAPYSSHHSPYRQHSQDSDKRTSLSSGASSDEQQNNMKVDCSTGPNDGTGSGTDTNTNIDEGLGDISPRALSSDMLPRSNISTTAAATHSAEVGTKGPEDVPPKPPMRSPREMETGQIGPLRIRRKRNSSSAEEDNHLSKNEHRLFEAVCTNNVGRAELLLTASGCSASCVDSRGRTPLHICAAHGYTHLVRLLLKHGADPNRLDSIGNRPLDLALSSRQTHVAAELILAGTNATADQDGAVAALSRLARQMLAELRAVDDVANVHTSKLYQSVRVLQHSMQSYHFSCPEVDEILKLLQEYGLSDPNPPPSAVDELSAALSNSLYFDR